MYLSAHLDPKPHQKASPGQQVASPRCLKGNMGVVIYLFASSLNPWCLQYREQRSPSSTYTQKRRSLPFYSLLTFCHWHTAQHQLCRACCLSVCIELCAHRARTLVAILLLNSEWHRHCRKERDRIQRERCPAVGSRPDIVHKEILGISFRQSSEACIIFDPGRTESECIWLLQKAQTVPFQQTCYTTGTGHGAAGIFGNAAQRSCHSFLSLLKGEGCMFKIAEI